MIEALLVTGLVYNGLARCLQRESVLLLLLTAVNLVVLLKIELDHALNGAAFEEFLDILSVGVLEASLVHDDVLDAQLMCLLTISRLSI